MAEFFYNATMRRYIIMFGRMFNDIDVVRYNSSNTPIQQIRVPIAYGPREKFLARLNQDPNLNKTTAIQLPRLSFELTDMVYAPERGLNKMNKSSSATRYANSVATQYTPVPYNFNMNLYGMFANNEDAVQVVEQIAPYFRPEWTMSMRLSNSVPDYYDIPTVLNSLGIEDTYEADFQTRRAILYTWSFTVKGYLFGPTKNKGIIKRTVIDMTVNKSTDPIGTEVGPNKKITLTPGLLANGSPTSNSSASVAASAITANTNYGYAFDTLYYFDGIDRHDH